MPGDLKLGAWYPLSGPVAASGVPSEAGAQRLLRHAQRPGGVNGRKVDFISEDTAFDPQQTLQVARRMVQRDGVQAIVTANGTAPTEATFPFVLDQSKVPIFGTYGGSSAWYEPAADGLFGTQALYEDQAKVAVNWALEEGAKDIVIVRDDPEAFATVDDAATEAIEAGGGSADRVVVKFGGTDFGPYVSEVKKKKPGRGVPDPPGARKRLPISTRPPCRASTPPSTPMPLRRPAP